jgi:GNAT superfamily N-acetyltransferase
MAVSEQAALPTTAVVGLTTVELGPADVPLLQRFFDENPAYFLAVQGEPAGPGEAHEEIHGVLPLEFPFTKKWLIGYVDEDGRLAAMANVISDLLAPGVWHIGLFIVATSRHGRGVAQTLLDELEAWARACGADWLRLGVVEGNTRAERFWASRGFIAVRRRGGYRMGRRTNVVCTMFKPLTGGTLAQYLELVERDRLPIRLLGRPSLRR